MRIDPTGEIWITVLVVSLLLFAIFSTSPRLQEALKTVTTMTAQTGSIDKGSFAFGIAVWGKSVFVGINMQGKEYDLEGNVIRTIKSGNMIDFGPVNINYTTFEDGTYSFQVGGQMGPYYLCGSISNGKLRFDGGFTFGGSAGIGLFGGSGTAEVNIIGYWYDKVFD